MLWLGAALAASSAFALEPDPAALKRGEFFWHPEIAPDGPIVVIVSLDEQRAFVYRNGIGIGVSTVSSGKKGYETPTGVYSILQKEKIHFSNKYDNAPMPYMERLTWDGVALHGGRLPGYPASHGCIRLPQAFAEKLFAITRRGITVVVADAKSAPAEVVHPAMLAPIGADGEPGSLSGADFSYEWRDPEGATGFISILVSTADRRVYVFRNGQPIGRAPYSAPEPAKVGGSVLFVMSDASDYVPSPLDPSRPKHHWEAFPIATRAGPQPRPDLVETFRVQDEFARRLYDVLAPGTTVLVTDLPAIRTGGPARSMRVLESSGTMTKALGNEPVGASPSMQ